MVRRTMTGKCNDRMPSCKTCNRWFGALALALSATLAGCAPKAGEPAPVPVVAGGWQAADPQEAEVQAAAAFAAAHLPQGHGVLAAVRSAETQVVAGTNLRMALQMADGTRWAVTVWHRLDGAFELTEVRQVP